MTKRTIYLIAPKNLQFVFRPTGKTRTLTPEFGAAYELPEVELVKVIPVGEVAEFDHVAEVEGFGYFYLYDADFQYDGNRSAALLSRTVTALDAGDNEVRTRTAPQSHIGYCAPEYRGGPHLHGSHGEPEFAAIPRRKTDRDFSTPTYTGVLTH